LFLTEELIALLAQQQSTRLYVASIKNLLNGLSSVADLLQDFFNYRSVSKFLKVIAVAHFRYLWLLEVEELLRRHRRELPHEKVALLNDKIILVGELNRINILEGALQEISTLGTVLGMTEFDDFLKLELAGFVAGFRGDVTNAVTRQLLTVWMSFSGPNFLPESQLPVTDPESVFLTHLCHYPTRNRLARLRHHRPKVQCLAEQHSEVFDK
jgi:hypothetical protein